MKPLSEKEEAAETKLILYNNCVSGNTNLMKILIVDDIAFNRRLLGMMLEQNGYTVVSASGGYEAIEQFQENTDIAVVICDLVMPDLDGIETLKQCQALKRTEDGEAVPMPPFLLLTEEIDSKQRKDAILAGYVEILSKPANKPQILKLMEEIDEGNYVSSNEPDRVVIFYSEDTHLETWTSYLEEKNYQVYASSVASEAFNHLSTLNKVRMLVFLEADLEQVEKLSDSAKAYYRNNNLPTVPFLGFHPDRQSYELLKPLCNLVLSLPIQTSQIDSALRTLLDSEVQTERVDAKVLYVDEVAFSRNTIAKSFKQHYVPFKVACSSEEAFLFYQADATIKVCLTKIDLADTTSEHFIEQLKKIQRYDDEGFVPAAEFVVLVDERDRNRAKGLEKLGVKKIFNKNVKLAVLMEELHSMLTAPSEKES